MQNRFKQLLEEKKLTATRFADLIKVNASAMSHILNGRSKPGFDVLDRIAQAFPDVNLNWLISGKGSIYNINSNTSTVSTPTQQKLFKEEETTVSTPIPPIIESPKEISSAIALAVPDKKIKRIILFFEDGKFEDYEK